MCNMKDCGEGVAGRRRLTKRIMQVINPPVIISLHNSSLPQNTAHKKYSLIHVDKWTLHYRKPEVHSLNISLIIFGQIILSTLYFLRYFPPSNTMTNIALYPTKF